MKWNYTLFLGLCCFFSASAQLEVTNANTAPYTPENLISNVLIGEGVQVDNINFSGDNAAIGFFDGGEASIGIERGIIMSTGEVANINGGPGAVGTGSNFASSNVGDGAIDPDLEDILQANGYTSRDVQTYTLEFVPTSDTLQFRYVFASEEYPEYACSFNDVFGFFISGPGIAGPYENGGENIAIVPGTNMPVSIDNVHAGNGPGCPAVNPEFYIDNNGSANQPTYDGFTQVFTAMAVVVPCETYTIKLAIADANDQIYDSAVFLEAKSFGTGRLDVETSTLSLDGTVVEECASGTVSFNLPVPAEDDVIIDYELFGTLDVGVDIAPIPGQVTIPAGDSTVMIDIIAFEDNMDEGIEFIAFDVQRDPCTRDTFYVYVDDNEIEEPNLPDVVEICASDTVTLNASLPIPIPPPITFTSNGGGMTGPNSFEFQDQINVFGIVPFDMGPGVIESVCFTLDKDLFIDDIDVFLIAPDGSFMELVTDVSSAGSDFTQTCFTETAIVDLGGIPAPPAPFTGNWAPEGVWSDVYDSSTNGTWTLYVIDDTQAAIIQQEETSTLIEWSITFKPVYRVDYAWTPTTGLSCSDCPAPVASPATTTTYTVVATDSYGCQVTDQITVDVTPIIDAPDVSCVTTTDDCITWSWNDVSGATDGYEVSSDDGLTWIPPSGMFEHTICGLAFNDTLTLQVRGLADCPGAIGMATCWTPDCPAAIPSIDNLVGTSCNGDTDGSIAVSSTGGSGTITYLLGSESNTTGNFTGLAGGNYTLTLTDEVQCSNFINFTVPEPDAAQVFPVPISNASCNGAADGSSTVVVMGGTGPYSFVWENGETDSIAISLPGGPNGVTVTDQNGCSVDIVLNVPEPDPIVPNLMQLESSCGDVATGIALAEPTGGTPDTDGTYTYQWDANANGQTLDTAYMLAGGSYTVTVTDVNGCTGIETVNIDANASITTNIIPTNASCNGVEDGSAFAQAVGGGGPPYSFQWDANADNQANFVAVNLTVGTYFVTITDGVGCTAVDSVVIDSPNSITITTEVSGHPCFDSPDEGSVIVHALGGTGPYLYLWPDGQNQADSIRTDLPVGTDTVIVQDLSGCFQPVIYTIDAPEELMLSLGALEPTCSGNTDGEITASVTGGVEPYSYNWSANAGGQADSLITGLSGDATYDVTVTDDNGCTITGSYVLNEPGAISASTSFTEPNCFGENGGTATVTASGIGGVPVYSWDDDLMQTTPTATGLEAGTYNVTVSDPNGICSVTAQVVVTEPDSLFSTTSVGSLACDGAVDGTATVNAFGGTEPYTYLWSNGQNTEMASGLSEDVHTVTVTDANGCVTTNSVDVAAPAALSIDISGTNLDCFQDNSGTVSVVAAGGAGGFSYAWSDASIGNTANPTGLGAATYSVTVSDQNGCTIDTMITLTQPEELTVSLTKTDITCFGDNDGMITSAVNGGTGVISYEWSNQSLSPNQTGLGPDTYQLTVTDENNCSAVAMMSILEPAEIVASTEATDVLCFGNATGAIDLTVSGGTGNLSFTWTNGGTPVSNDEDLIDQTAGTYDLLITDASGCTLALSTTIDQPDDPVELTIMQPDTICFGTSTGVATVEVTGGTGPFEYVWAHGALDATAQALTAGDYFVTVTDAGGCTYTASTNVPEAPEITLTLDQTTATCHDGEDGTAFIDQISYGQLPTNTGDFEFTWSTVPPQTSPIATNLTGGLLYAVTVTNNRGCTGVGSVEIDNPEPVVAEIAQTTDVRCFAGSDGTITAQGTGGSAPYTYFWTGNPAGQEDAVLTGLSAGSYSITVADAFDCRGTTQIEIDQPLALVNDIETDEVACFGEQNGVATAQTQGGTAPYNYAWSNGAAASSNSGVAAGVYQLTITDTNDCILLDSAVVEQPEMALTALTDGSDVTCFDGRDGEIFVTADGGTAPYQFSYDGGAQFFSTNQFVGLTAGDYELVARDSRGCLFFTDEVTLTQPDSIEILLIDQITANLGFIDPIVLEPEVSNAVGDLDVVWTSQFGDYLSCPTCLVTTVDSLMDSNIFYLSITDERGCTAEDFIRINIDKNRGVLVPTGFTPNNDGRNDLLLVHGKKNTTVTSFQIFDRWSEQVYLMEEPFQVNDTTVGWDGTFKGQDAPVGKYIYQVVVTYQDGQTETFVGETTLIR